MRQHPDIETQNSIFNTAERAAYAKAERILSGRSRGVLTDDLLNLWAEKRAVFLDRVADRMPTPARRTT